MTPIGDVPLTRGGMRTELPLGSSAPELPYCACCSAFVAVAAQRATSGHSQDSLRAGERRFGVVKLARDHPWSRVARRARPLRERDLHQYLLATPRSRISAIPQRRSEVLLEAMARATHSSSNFHGPRHRRVSRRPGPTVVPPYQRDRRRDCSNSFRWRRSHLGVTAPQAGPRKDRSTGSGTPTA